MGARARGALCSSVRGRVSASLGGGPSGAATGSVASGQPWFPLLSNGVIVLSTSQGCVRSRCRERQSAPHRMGPSGPAWHPPAPPFGAAVAEVLGHVHRRLISLAAPADDWGLFLQLPAVVLTQDCSVYEDIPCCRTCLLIAPFWFQSWGRKHMLLPVDLSRWSGCQQRGWVGVGEGSQPLPSPLAPPHPQGPYLVSDPKEPESLEI